MGYLLIDHSQGQGVDGRQGKKEEYRTVSCKHCQAVIKIIIRGAAGAQSTKYRCSRCNGPICRYCAEVLKGEKICRPAMKMIEGRVRLIEDRENFDRWFTRILG